MDKFYLETFTDTGGAWRFHVKSINGNIIASSEAYSSKQACWDTVMSFAESTALKVSVKLGGVPNA